MCMGDSIALFAALVFVYWKRLFIKRKRHIVIDSKVAVKQMVEIKNILGWFTIDRFGIIFGIIVGVISLAIARIGIIPDIEVQYTLKKVDETCLETEDMKEYFKSRKNKYGDKYSHLELYNGGNGKASNIEMSFNWDVDGTGRLGGLSKKGLPEDGNIEMVYEDFLFPDGKQIHIPAIGFGSDVFENAERILIRIKYKDLLGISHCKCAFFIKCPSDRGYTRLNKYNRSCSLIRIMFCRQFDEDICKLEYIPSENKLGIKKGA